MKRERISYVVSRIIIAVMIIFMISIFIRMFTRVVLIDMFNIEGTIVDIVMFDRADLRISDKKLQSQNPNINIDWAAEYPFEEGKQPVEGSAVENIQNPILERYKETVFSLEGMIEAYTSDNVIFHSKFIEIGSLYRSIIDWNIYSPNEEKKYVVVSDDYIISLIEKCETSEMVNFVADFQNFLDSQDIPLVYVQTPAKICKDDSIDGVADFANESLDELISDLEANHINCIDLRQMLHEEKKSHHEVFFDTDHHWRAETGLWAAKRTAEYLNEKTDILADSDILSPENFTSEVYEDIFLGTKGKKISLSVVEPDDVTLLYPKKSVDMQIEVPEKGISKTGGFEIMYSLENLEVKDYYYDDIYNVFMCGSSMSPVVHITNNSVENDYKILVISDSFKTTYSPFLSLLYNKVDSIDLRTFTGSVETLIKKNGYDAVVVLYSEMSVLPMNANCFNFK